MASISTRYKLLAGALLALGTAASVQAASIPLFVTGLNDLEIINRENVYRSDASCAANGGCLAFDSANDPTGYRRADPAQFNNILKGDIFVVGQATRSVTNLNAGTTWDQDNTQAGGVETFTGYSVQEVDSVALDVNGTADRIVFKTASADPFNILSAADLAAGVMVRLFADTTTAYRFDGVGLTTFQSIASLTDGSFWADLGIGGTTASAAAPGLEADGYLYAEVNIGLGLTNFQGDFNAAFNVITKYAAYSAGELAKINDPAEVLYGGALLGDPGVSAANNAAGTCTATATYGCYDIAGNGQLSANQNVSPWQFASEDPFQLHTIPEPGSLALAGLALGAMGLAGRARRKSAS